MNIVFDKQMRRIVQSTDNEEKIDVTKECVDAVIELMLFLDESLKLKNNYRLSILSDDELVITKDGYDRLKNEVERLKKESKKYYDNMVRLAIGGRDSW